VSSSGVRASDTVSPSAPGSLPYVLRSRIWPSRPWTTARAWSCGRSRGASRDSACVRSVGLAWHRQRPRPAIRSRLVPR